MSTLIIFSLYSLALCLNCNKVILLIDMFPFNSSLQDLPIVAKLFAPSVRCPTCGHANDSDFHHCQRCGYNRKILNSGKRTALAIDLDVIDDQLRQLALFDQATSYSKQKDSLQRELENFLSSLPGCLTIATVTPRDICRFLVYRDKNGKTQVNRNGCPHLGKTGTHDCPCPLRLSYKAIGLYIGKLRAIFHAHGHDGKWDKRIGLGNPAADRTVKVYLHLVTAEQLQARVTLKQATPFFVEKLSQLTAHIDRNLQSMTITPRQCFILARDQAYFKAVFFSGDRPGDMGQVKVPEILRFPNNDGFLFNHV